MRYLTILGTSGDRDTAADAGVCVWRRAGRKRELTAEALSKLYLVLRSTDTLQSIWIRFPISMMQSVVPVTVDDEMVANRYPEDKMGETVN